MSPTQLEAIAQENNLDFEWVLIPLTDTECELLALQAILCAQKFGQAGRLLEFLMMQEIDESCSARNFLHTLEPSKLDLSPIVKCMH